jgi:hypothetical protein
MAEVEDYTSGKILRDVKIALLTLKLVKLPIIGGYIGKKLIRKIEKFEPKLVSLEGASDLIENAEKVAVGNRVCYELHKTNFTESVFLNELAEGMVKAGKARFVSKEEAIKILGKYTTPIIVSRVGGEYAEICRSHPKTCVYWNAERRGLRCLKRR